MKAQTAMILLGLCAAPSLALDSSIEPVDELEMNIFEKVSESMSGSDSYKKDDSDFQKAYNDKASVDWIAASSITGMFVWIWSCLFYKKSAYEDNTMDYNQPPIAWFWVHLTDDHMGWTAASYFSFFFGYLIISMVEFAAWIMLYAYKDGVFLAIWAPVAQYGGMVLYTLPFVFAMLQIWMPTENGGINAPKESGWLNAVVLLIIGLANWFFHWIVHFFYADRVVDHIAAKNIVKLQKLCKCDKWVANESETEEQQKVSSVNAVKTCYSKLKKDKCLKVAKHAMYQKCQGAFGDDLDDASLQECNTMSMQRCEANRDEGQTDDEYLAKCKSVSLVLTGDKLEIKETVESVDVVTDKGEATGKVELETEGW